ncbi:SMI1/KNR4 family protein [Parasulfitobacter algicola]|uniref:SMI1/KNR4 family protein n=1 Tax=Parasulfitobacter algicola TaxID=2614809 RepID=A0ABX2J1G0_9RHOB|nr:SMI1/KNR4 family protein [Sulfitobacter algicola]NSX56738.1 SMI1/KNR4 family protein [Sulfitobacter algicola]
MSDSKNDSVISTLAATFSLALFPIALYYGFMGRSTWVIVPLSLAFVFSMYFGSDLKRDKGFKDTLDLVLDVIVMAGLSFFGIAAFFFVGFGISAAFYPDYDYIPALQRDLIVAAIVGGFSGLLTLADHAHARRKTQQTSDIENQNAFQLSDLRMTAETIFEQRYNDPNWTLQVAEAQIQKKEKELGLTLPDGLRALYHLQDGGPVRKVVVPAVRNPRPDNQQDWVNPFPSCREIFDVDSIETLSETAEYADLPNSVFQGAEHLIVISEFYGETMLVDCRPDAHNQIVFAQFYSGNWRRDAITFRDFKALWDTLRVTDEVAGEIELQIFDKATKPAVFH